MLIVPVEPAVSVTLAGDAASEKSAVLPPSPTGRLLLELLQPVSTAKKTGIRMKKCFQMLRTQGSWQGTAGARLRSTPRAELRIACNIDAAKVPVGWYLRSVTTV
jgi:hypothetical protein